MQGPTFDPSVHSLQEHRAMRLTMGIFNVIEVLHIKLDSCKIGRTSMPFVDANGPDSRSSTYGATVSLLCGGE